VNKRKKSTMKLCTSTISANTTASVSTAQRIDVAYSDIGNTSDKARAENMHRSTATRCEEIVANADLENSIQDVHILLDQLQAKGERLYTFFELLQFDGSRQRISIQLDPYVSNEAQCSGWEVIVVRRCLRFSTDRHRYFVELPSQPIPSLGNNAGCYHDAMWGHASTKSPSALTLRLTRRSLFTGLCRAGDEAMPCYRLMDHEANNLMLQEGHSFYPCALHGTHLSVGFFLHAVGIEHLNVAYSLSQLLGNGGYFLRLIFAARVQIASTATPLQSVGSALQLQLAEEFLIMCEAKYASKEQTQRLEVARKKFLAVFNGGFLVWVTQRSMGHCCAGLSCCRNWDHTLERMNEAVISYMLACRPQSPALARWTLVAPAVKFQLRLWVFHSMLPQLVDKAFDSIKSKLMADVEKESDATKQHTDNGIHMEAEVLQEFYWHAVNGKRLQTCQTYLDCIKSQPSTFFFHNIYIYIYIYI
jgi:hypothetical protein